MRTPTAKLTTLATSVLFGSSTLLLGPAYAAPAAIPDCDLSSLPAQAAETLDLVHTGGPFPYRQDGTVFQNREGILPSEPRGYYHEYTVETPGSSTRGARRLVGGGPATDPAFVYYTADHYSSFCEVDEDA